MLYGKRDELDKVGSFNIMYCAIHIEQNHTLAYVGCSLDEIFSSELLPDINKTISNLDFHIRKMKFLFEPLRRLHCNALIQPHLNYACSSWYLNLNNRLKSNSQILQNKCIGFCRIFNDRVYIGLPEFDELN